MERDQIRDGGGQPVYQIVRQGIKPAKITATLSREHLSMIGWRVLEEVPFVEWCGHAQHFLVVPHAYGERAALVPILADAA